MRSEKSIKGITVRNEECKISQYADDSMLILNGSQQSLKQALALLDEFRNISGLKINYDKTDALWIGSLCKNKDILFPEKNIQWSTDRVKALGVWFSVTNKNTIAHINYTEKLASLKMYLITGTLEGSLC